MKYSAYSCGRITRICRMAVLLLACIPVLAFGHGVAEGDATYIQGIEGVHFLPYMYLGAKHMFTGYDHLLFLA